MLQLWFYQIVNPQLIALLLFKLQLLKDVRVRLRLRLDVLRTSLISKVFALLFWSSIPFSNVSWFRYCWIRIRIIRNIIYFRYLRAAQFSWWFSLTYKDHLFFSEEILFVIKIISLITKMTNPFLSFAVCITLTHSTSITLTHSTVN